MGEGFARGRKTNLEQSRVGERILYSNDGLEQAPSAKSRAGNPERTIQIASYSSLPLGFGRLAPRSMRVYISPCCRLSRFTAELQCRQLPTISMVSGSMREGPGRVRRNVRWSCLVWWPDRIVCAGNQSISGPHLEFTRIGGAQPVQQEPNHRPGGVPLRSRIGIDKGHFL